MNDEQTYNNIDVAAQLAKRDMELDSLRTKFALADAALKEIDEYVDGSSQETPITIIEDILQQYEVELVKIYSVERLPVPF